MANSNHGRAGMTVAMPFIALLAGIPFLIGIYIDALILQAIFGWDTWTVFLVQAVPITVVVVIAATVAAARGDLDT